MSKPVTEDLFSFKGRRNRKSYFLFLILNITAVVIGFLALGLGITMIEDDVPLGLVPLAIGAVILFLAWLSGVAVMAQRFRDFEWTGWSVLTTLIPYVGQFVPLIVIFIPPSEGDNKYGPNPLGAVAPVPPQPQPAPPPTPAPAPPRPAPQVTPPTAPRPAPATPRPSPAPKPSPSPRPASPSPAAGGGSQSMQPHSGSGAPPHYIHPAHGGISLKKN